ncbi:hypothetical protein SMICM17S_11681 [Streptomyces microflavus]
MVAAVVDEHDRQAVAVQGGEVAEGVLRLHDDEPVEGARRHLGGEALDGLGAPVAGEQQQPVVGGLDGVDDALEQFAHPRPGQRGDQHADGTAGAAGQAHGSGAGHIAELCDHFTNAGGGGTVHLALGVDDPGHGRLADAGLTGDIGDGDAHLGLRWTRQGQAEQGWGRAAEHIPGDTSGTGSGTGTGVAAGVNPADTGASILHTEIGPDPSADQAGRVVRSPLERMRAAAPGWGRRLSWASCGRTGGRYSVGSTPARRRP